MKKNGHNGNGSGLEAYRRMLLAKRAEMQASLGMRFDTLASMGRVAEEDQAQISHDEFISLRLNRLVYRELRQVNEALDRLEHGEYGICQECDEPISPKRLQVLPWARYCVRCQEGSRGEMDDAEQPEPELSPANAW